MTFCDALREKHAELWQQVTSHRLIDDMLDGTIPKRVLARYLAQDHRFLDAFVVLLASAIAAARCLDDRIPGCQFLALITGRENTYFERALDALAHDADAERAAPDGAATAAFCRLMREAAASAELGQMLAVLVVAEWSYQTWGERARALLRDDAPFWCAEWVELHSGDYFGSVVSYLKGMLDAEAARLSAAVDSAALERASLVFARALQLELDFFEQAYEVSS